MKRTDSKVRLWEMAALLALCAALCAGTWAQREQERISSGLVRLHVIAVSDDEEEQAVKLRVRDAVLDHLAPRLKGAESPEEAREIIQASLESTAGAAAAAAEGRQVTVSLGPERYPTRDYGGFSLPAGEYESLRVILGEGKGHNWWCVVFPPLCLQAAQAEDMAAVMGRDEVELITGGDGYELRFKIVELWGELMNLLDRE